MPAMAKLVAVERVREERFGEGGFLTLHRARLCNVHADGTRSAEYVCDYVSRPVGLDAVAVVVWTRASGRVRVLIRPCLRPPIQLGRGSGVVPIPDATPRPLLNPEVVAGLIEASDRGEAGVRRRAAIEVHEEAGYRVAPEDVVLLGAPAMPVPGLLPEMHFYAAAFVVDPDARERPPGDGSPMEDGAHMLWYDLDQAIAACTSGAIQDTKTEVALRRLRDHLAKG
jgi:ADP-ribose pyrophosphatase